MTQRKNEINETNANNLQSADRQFNINCMDPTKILFICLGNICRSPAAHGIMQALVDEQGLSDQFVIDSAGLGDWHIGDLPDRRMLRAAAKRGLNLTHRARQITQQDFRDFDLIIGIDTQNISALRRLAPDEASKSKIKLITEYSSIRPRPEIVPDPYYGDQRDFYETLDLLQDACQGLLNALQQK